MVLDIPEHDLFWDVSGCEGLRGDIHVAGGVPPAPIHTLHAVKPTAG
jgi:hypothetical protein